MWPLTSSAFIAIAILSLPLVSQATYLSRSAEERAVDCCTSLEHKLGPGKVIFPGTSAFNAQLQEYYSIKETSLVSACRISPACAQDVSIAVGILSRGNCTFAVRSGGHMFWSGAANVAAPGITFDLQSMNTISFSKDKKVARFEPGAHWGKVYDALDAVNLTVVGARSNSVGVGGFILGGGFSNRSPQHGFASDNVVNYQIVLANGEIVDASATNHSDLFFALKAGSTNFGIITRYDVTTFPGGPMWGGFIFYNYSTTQEREASDALLAFMVKLRQSPLGGASFSSGFNGGQDSLIATIAYLGADGSNTDLFSDILGVPNRTMDTLRANVNQQSLSGEVDKAFPPGQRTEWGTLTFKADSQLAVDISSKGREIFTPFHPKAGFSWNVNFQAVPVPMLEAVQANPNPQGLTSADGDLLLFFVFWADEADDTAIQAAVRQVIDWGKQTAQARGLWVPWLYLNYALPDQPVYAGYGEANVARLREIKDEYDPGNVFGKLWSGGFKL